MRSICCSNLRLRLRFIAIFMTLSLLSLHRWNSNQSDSSETTVEQLLVSTKKFSRNDRLVGEHKENDEQRRPFCQGDDRFLLFKDKGKSGLQHKLDDFFEAADMAVRTDRVLVDFSPALRADYMRNKYMETVIPNATFRMRYYHGWSWTNLLDTSRIDYMLRFHNGTKLRCKLRIILLEEFQHLYLNSSHTKSVVSIEFGKKYPENLAKTFYRIYHAKNYENFTIFHRPNLTTFVGLIQRRPFSKFITSSAEYIKKRCFELSEERNTKNKRRLELPNRFIVVHLRGAYLSCAQSQKKPEEMILRIEQIGVNKTRDVVYLMTDLGPKSAHFRALRNYFEGFYLFQASDMNLYDHSVFSKTAALLIYATELQLQEIADGIVETYKFRHKMPNAEKIIGHLSDLNTC